MGCDIHFYVEKKVDGVWISADKWTNSGYGENELIVSYDNAFYSGRNYDLFSILANVRNGYGFAGVTTGSGFVPISDPKGFPEDASGDVSDENDSWNGDGHSHSYFTLSELLNYDWTQKTNKSGVVTIDEWVRWKQYGSPNSWSGHVGGGSTKIFSSEEFEKAWCLLCESRGYSTDSYWKQFKSGDNKNDNLKTFKAIIGSESPYARVLWEVSYFEAASVFLSQTIPKMLKLSEGDFDSVRCVFWFDN